MIPKPGSPAPTFVRPPLLLNVLWGVMVLNGCSAGSKLPDPEVVTDGRFQEWAGVPVLLQDPVDAGEDAAVDLGAIQAAADGRHLFFTLETGRYVNAQAMPGTLSILLDTDDDPGTGASVEGFSGVDLVVELSRQEVQEVQDGPAYGSGMAVREVGPEGVPAEGVNASPWDLVVAPTHSTDRFELRLARVPEGGGGHPRLAGPKARVAFLFTTQGTVRDRTEIATLRLPPLDPTPPPAWSESLVRRGDLRVMVWNVASEGFRDRPERFARVMAAVEPDVLLLDEVFGEVTEEDVRAFLSRPEMESLGRWDFVLGKSGGRQKTLVASRTGLRPEPALQRISYPEGSLDGLYLEYPEARSYIDLEMERGLPSVGGWVDVDGQAVLFVPVDLQSAGHDGSPEDELRIIQARALRDAVAGALGAWAPGAALVIGGDLNLVGSRAPLEALGLGLDGDGDLAPVDAYRLTDRSMSTWRDPRTRFTPGRLDFVLISGSTLSADGAFVFDADELSADLRTQMGVDAGDATSTSDHLPVVVDLSRKGSSSGAPAQERLPCEAQGADPWVGQLRDRVLTYDGLALFAADRFGAAEACVGAVTTVFDGSSFGSLLVSFPGGVSLEVVTMPPESSVTTLRVEDGFPDEAAMARLLEEYAEGLGLKIDWGAPEVLSDGGERIQRYWDPDPGLNASASLVYQGSRLVAVSVSMAL